MGLYRNPLLDRDPKSAVTLQGKIFFEEFEIIGKKGE